MSGLHYSLIFLGSITSQALLNTTQYRYALSVGFQKESFNL